LNSRSGEEDATSTVIVPFLDTHTCCEWRKCEQFWNCPCSTWPCDEWQQVEPLCRRSLLAVPLSRFSLKSAVDAKCEADSSPFPFTLMEGGMWPVPIIFYSFPVLQCSSRRLRSQWNKINSNDPNVSAGNYSKPLKERAKNSSNSSPVFKRCFGEWRIVGLKRSGCEGGGRRDVLYYNRHLPLRSSRGTPWFLLVRRPTTSTPFVPHVSDLLSKKAQTGAPVVRYFPVFSFFPVNISTRELALTVHVHRVAAKIPGTSHETHFLRPQEAKSVGR